MTSNITCFMPLKKRKEKSIPPTTNPMISPQKIIPSSNLSLRKSNSPSQISQTLKRQNPEKPKRSKTPIQTRNADTGLQMKINDTIGSLSYITNIFLISTFVEPIESSNPWLHLLKPEKPSSAEAIIKRWRKNTNTFQKSL